MRYRPAVLSYESLLERAISLSCDQRVYATTDTQLALAKARVGDRAIRFGGEKRIAKASDQLYYLSLSHLRLVPLTSRQAVQVNAALGAETLGPRAAGTDAPWSSYLSPRQSRVEARIRTAIEKNSKAFQGLTRPSEATQLDEYWASLSERLTSVEAKQATPPPSQRTNTR